MMLNQWEQMMLEKLSAEDFAPFLKEKFLINFSHSEPSPVYLIEINEKKSTSPGSRRQPFSIIFRAAKDMIWPQGIYKIKHEKLGVLDLFLVPVGPDQEGMCYEAVFN